MLLSISERQYNFLPISGHSYSRVVKATKSTSAQCMVQFGPAVSIEPQLCVRAGLSPRWSVFQSDSGCRNQTQDALSPHQVEHRGHLRNGQRTAPTEFAELAETRLQSPSDICNPTASHGTGRAANKSNGGCALRRLHCHSNSMEHLDGGHPVGTPMVVGREPRKRSHPKPHERMDRHRTSAPEHLFRHR
jgi:hypothetical protein